MNINSNSNRPVIILLISIFVGGPLLTLLIIFITSSPSKPQSNISEIVKEKRSVDSNKLIAKTTPSENPKADSSLNESEPVKRETQIDYSNKANTSIADDKVQSIAEIVKTTSDDNFNTRLSITISNPYHKSLANVQLYISQDGNSYIPDDLPENSSQLINIGLADLPPGKEKTISITSNDKGNKNILYAINTRKIRFSDGVLLTK
jgi:hypothetical protein